MAKDLEAVKVHVLKFLELNYPGFKDIFPGIITIFNEGKIANATVLRYTGNNLDIVIKDFSGSPRIIRSTLGRYFIFTEARSLKGKILAHYKNQKMEKEFFLRLEEIVHKMHDNGLAHMDLRCYGNVIVGKDGLPYIIDLQSAVNIKWMPQIIQRILKSSDLSGVYKCWKFGCSAPLDQEREIALKKFNRMKKFWILRGYPSKYFRRKEKAAVI